MDYGVVRAKVNARAIIEYYQYNTVLVTIIDLSDSVKDNNRPSSYLIPITLCRILYICIACTLSSVHVLHA